MAERMDRVAEQACERAFLYEDPDSFRAGVREALRAIEAAFPQPPRLHDRIERQIRPARGSSTQPVEGAVEAAAATL